MLSLTFIFWFFVLLFAVIGAMRGWAKKCWSRFAVILGLFIVIGAGEVCPADPRHADGRIPLLGPRRRSLPCWYSSATRPRISRAWPSRTALSGRHLQDVLLGIFLGGVNGYLIFGTLWFFMHDANYPFAYITPPSPLDAIGRGSAQADPDVTSGLAGQPGDLFRRCDRIRLCPGGVYLMEHIHLIGIGGTGLSAIARVLLESGYTVSGSDRTLSPLAQSLREAGVRVDLGHRAENVFGADQVVRSSAIPDENPEVQAALAAGIPVLKRSDFLGQLIRPGGDRRRRHPWENHHHRDDRLGIYRSRAGSILSSSAAS